MADKITGLGDFDRSIPGNAADPARVIGKTGGKITGYDYCVEDQLEGDDSDLCDTDLPGGLTISNGRGARYG